MDGVLELVFASPCNVDANIAKRSKSFEKKGETHIKKKQLEGEHPPT